MLVASWLVFGLAMAQGPGPAPTMVLSNPSLEALRQAFAPDTPSGQDEPGERSSGSLPRKPRMRSIVVDANPPLAPRVVAVAIPFQLNSASLSTESAALIDHLAIVLRDVASEASVVIEGHTDATGSAELNRRLSLARAETVMRALVARSVNPNRLLAEGHGHDRPLEGRLPFDAAHRRVQFRVEVQP